MKAKYTRKPDADELYELYTVERKTLTKIGGMFATSASTVSAWLKSFGINQRTQSESALYGKVRPSPDELYDMYITDEMSIVEIGEHFGIGVSTVSRWMADANINMRTLADTALLKNPRLSKDELYKLYIEDGMNTIEIGELLNVSCTTISRWLNRAGVTRRSISDRQLKNCVRPEDYELFCWYIIDDISIKEISDNLGTYPMTIRSWLIDAGIDFHSDPWHKMRSDNKPNKEDLHQMYIVDRLNAREISDVIGVSNASVCKWLREYDINIRTLSDYSGKYSWNWKGGISFAPYCHKFDNTFKEFIRNKFGRACFLCEISEEEQQIAQMSRGKQPSKLSVHHVSYRKQCLCDDVDCKFVPLCARCHAMTGNNRFYWFSLIMCKLYLESSATFLTNMQFGGT